MAEYLSPNEYGLTIEDQRNTFSIRNRMIDIPANFSKKPIEVTCVCGKLEDMKHIYTCEALNNHKMTTEYEEIFSENVYNIKIVYRQFEENIKIREDLKEKISQSGDMSHPFLYLSKSL